MLYSELQNKYWGYTCIFVEKIDIQTLPHNTVMSSFNFYIRIKAQNALTSNNSFGFAYMLFLEKELTI